jgi:hypothetical protein
MKLGSSTLMGIISGTVFALTLLPPTSICVFPAVFLYGIVCDLYMYLLGSTTYIAKTKHVILATILSSAVMSLVALIALTWVGVLPTNGLVFTWSLGVLRDVAVGLFGSVLELRILKYVIHRAT